MVQKGPYTYREIRPKIDVKTNPNHTLSFRQNKTYIFDRDLSVGPDNDTFTTANLPVVVGIHMHAMITRLPYIHVGDIDYMVLKA